MIQPPRASFAQPTKAWPPYLRRLATAKEGHRWESCPFQSKHLRALSVEFSQLLTPATDTSEARLSLKGE